MGNDVGFEMHKSGLISITPHAIMLLSIVQCLKIEMKDAWSNACVQYESANYCGRCHNGNT